MSTNRPRPAKEPTMPATLTHPQLTAAIKPDPPRLAVLLEDASRDYNALLEKLDGQAGWIVEKMQRLQANIAHARESDPLTLSVNAIGELQGQSPELDRLCSQLATQKQYVRRLTEALGVSA